MKFGEPFVLLEDTRPGAAPARLFADACETIVAWRLEEVGPALEQVRRGLARNLHAAGWLSYEAGLSLEPRLLRLPLRNEAPRFPLLWFGLFHAPQRINADELARAFPDQAGAYLSPPIPRISAHAYESAFQRVRDYIVAGDVYQVNLSYRADLAFVGHPLAAYARLRENGLGGWSGVVFDGAHWLLSTSPELFFRITDGVAEARPMKGTAKRSADPVEDRALAEALRRDPKELAENVMIVDLIRNDLSRLAKRGSVQTSDLFTVETYPTLHTLTSTVRADLKDDYDPIDALRALFPCGSITGAPKIRAMEIVRELEIDDRGPYTGAIGWISPNGDAAFNVAIRTVAIAGGKAELGLGSAIVYDSDVESEWDECRTKGAFVTRGAPAFDLIETMRCISGEIWRLDLHVERLRASAMALRFALDADQVKADLIAAARLNVDRCSMRLTLNRDGVVRITTQPSPRFASDVVEVIAVTRKVEAYDFRLRHKTTLRSLYDDARREAGAEEIVFVDVDGFLTEGSFTNVFVKRGDVLVTPPLSRGLLPGVLRAHLLETGEAREADLRVSDLAEGFFIGNAARDLVAARFVGI